MPKSPTASAAWEPLLVGQTGFDGKTPQILRHHSTKDMVVIRWCPWTNGLPWFFHKASINKACSETGSTAPLVIRGEDCDDSGQIAAYTEMQFFIYYHIRNFVGNGSELMR